MPHFQIFLLETISNIIHDNTREDRRLISDPVISLSNKERQILVTQTIFDSNGKLAGIIAGFY